MGKSIKSSLNDFTSFFFADGPDDDDDTCPVALEAVVSTAVRSRNCGGIVDTTSRLPISGREIK